MRRGWPVAAMRMSAVRQRAGRFSVRLWATVTVALQPGMLLHEEGGEWFADDVAAADDDNVLAGDGDVGGHEEMLDAAGRAGDDPGFAEEEAADVVGMKSVDVFVDRYAAHDVADVQVGGERLLDEDGVNVGVLVEELDLAGELGWGDGLRKLSIEGEDADTGAAFFLGVDVGARGGILSDEDKGEARLSALQAGDEGCGLVFDIFGNRSAVDQWHCCLQFFDHMIVETAIGSKHCFIVEELPLGAVIVAHSAAGLLDEEFAGSKVPWLKRNFPVGVKPSGGDVGEVDGGGAEARMGMPWRVMWAKVSMQWRGFVSTL